MAVPTIEGQSYVGITLNAHPGVWGPQTVGLAYQWLRSGQPVANAINRTYRLTEFDLGARISVTVTGIKEGYTSVAMFSAPTQAVTVGALTVATPLTVTGGTKLGGTLTMHLPSWSPQADMVQYAWRRDGMTLLTYGATSYTITAGDLGHSNTALASATKIGYAMNSQRVDTAIASLATFDPAPTPTILGTPLLGGTLTAVSGHWGPGTTLTFQWAANGDLIAGATSGTYQPLAADAGKRLTLRVTASQTGFATASRTSEPTAAVTLPVISPAPLPTISGPTVLGNLIAYTELMASTGTWGAADEPAVTFTYRWYVGGVLSSSISRLSVFNDSAGKTVYVVVTGSQPGHAPVSRTSAVVGPILLMPGTLVHGLIVNEAVNGTVVQGETLTLNPARWSSGISGGVYSWRFQRGGSSCADTYTPTALDVGKTITVTQRTNLPTGGNVFTVTLTVLPRTLTQTKLMTVSGTNENGQTLAVSPPEFNVTPDVVYYSWRPDDPLGRGRQFGAQLTYSIPTVIGGGRILLTMRAEKAGYPDLVQTIWVPAASQ